MIALATTCDTGYAPHLRQRGLGEATIREYGKDVSQFLLWRSTRDICGTIESDMVAWVHEMREGGQSAAALRRRIASCRSYLRFLGVENDPFADYRKPPLPSARPHPLPGGIDEGIRMVECSTGKTRHAVALGLFAGLRVSEICSITREDVNAARMELRVKGKGEKVRFIPTGAKLAELLNEMPEQGRLVPLSTTVARRYITRAGVAAGVNVTVSSHDLRATFASECYRVTKDIVLVSRLLGHASVHTTQVYLSWDYAEMRKAVDF